MWWPGLDDDIASLVKSCGRCQSTRSAPLVAQLHPWEWPSKPWCRLHIDFAGPFMGKMFIVIVDAMSKRLDVQVMKSITASETIKTLKIFLHMVFHRKLSQTMVQPLQVMNSRNLCMQMV